MRATAALLASAALLLSARHTQAQDHKMELSGSMGYTFSEGVDIEPFNLMEGGVLTALGVESGHSYGAAIDFQVVYDVFVGFNWSQQDARLTGRLQREGERDITDMTINNYHGTLTFQFPNPWRDAIPFVLLGFGATDYTFSDIRGQPVESDTRFSSTWGFGFKFYGDNRLGLRLMGRWTPTFIRSQESGYWCNYYGCWESDDAEYSNQFELAGSILLRI